MREAHGPQWQAHSLRSNLGSTLLSRMMLDRLLDRPVLSFVTPWVSTLGGSIPSSSLFFSKSLPRNLHQ